MIYIYRNSSKSATGLAAMVNEMGAKCERMKQMDQFAVKPTDLVVNWGAYRDHWPAGWRVINPHIVGDKLRELRLFIEAKVPCPEVRMEKPKTGEWIARRREHEEASDVRAALEYGDYYTRKLDIDKEFRFHIWKGESIRQQYKCPHPEAIKKFGLKEAHPWIRSWASGWDWTNGGDGTSEMREGAKLAVKAVGYDFGAVDVGRLRGGGFVVLEVNSGPGIDPGGTTCEEYAKRIIAASKV